MLCVGVKLANNNNLQYYIQEQKLSTSKIEFGVTLINSSFISDVGYTTIHDTEKIAWLMAALTRFTLMHSAHCKKIVVKVTAGWLLELYR